MPEDVDTPEDKTSAVLAARCHEIQTGLGMREVPRFETLIETGMSIRLALHIRGLPTISYDVVKLVVIHLLGIPTIAVKRILNILADVEFVKLGTEGETIKTVLMVDYLCKAAKTPPEVQSKCEKRLLSIQPV